MEIAEKNRVHAVIMFKISRFIDIGCLLLQTIARVRTIYLQDSTYIVVNCLN